jgi:hypothetical protein
MDIAQQINKQIDTIAADAAARQALIGKASRHAAEMLGAKIAEASGVFPREETVAGFEGAFTNTLAKTVDAILSKNVRLDDSTAFALGEALASHEFEQHEPRLRQVVREKNERIAASDRKNMPSPQSELAQREQGAGVTNAGAANLPLLDAASALVEITNRAGKQYPAKRK